MEDDATAGRGDGGPVPAGTLVTPGARSRGSSSVPAPALLRPRTPLSRRRGVPRERIGSRCSVADVPSITVPPPGSRDQAAQRGHRGPRRRRRPRPGAGRGAGLGQREAGRLGRCGDRRDRSALAQRQPPQMIRDAVTAFLLESAGGDRAGTFMAWPSVLTAVPRGRDSPAVWCAGPACPAAALLSADGSRASRGRGGRGIEGEDGRGVSAVVEEQGDGQDGPAASGRVRAEPRWPVAVVVAGAVGLQAVLPGAFTPGHRLVPVLELVLLVGLVGANPGRLDTPGRWLRRGSVALVGMISVTNAWSAVRLVQAIISGNADNAIALLSSGAAIWATNVVVFGLWYWELDRGGPHARLAATRGVSDGSDHRRPREQGVGVRVPATPRSAPGLSGLGAAIRGLLVLVVHERHSVQPH